MPLNRFEKVDFVALLGETCAYEIKQCLSRNQ
jgi:hypothetical protein